MRRFLGTVAQPKPFTVYLDSCGQKVELALNEEVVRYHYGEDGAGYEIERTRSYQINSQNVLSGQMQDWFWDEHMDSEFENSYLH